MATVNNNDAFKALIAQVIALAATVTDIQASNETKMDALQATIEASANKATATAFVAILAATKAPAADDADPAADKANPAADKVDPAVIKPALAAPADISTNSPPIDCCVVDEAEGTVAKAPAAATPVATAPEAATPVVTAPAAANPAVTAPAAAAPVATS